MRKLQPVTIPLTTFKPITTEPDLHVPRIIQWSQPHNGYIGECWCGRTFRAPNESLESVLGAILDHEDTAVIGE